MIQVHSHEKRERKMRVGGKEEKGESRICMQGHLLETKIKSGRSKGLVLQNMFLAADIAIKQKYNHAHSSK